MKALFTTTAILLVLLGLGWLVAPEAMFAQWGIAGDEIAAYMGRRYAGLLLGYALLLWVARASPPSAGRDAIVIGGIAATLVMTGLSVYGVLTHVTGGGMWITVAIEAALSAWFIGAWVASRRPAISQPAS